MSEARAAILGRIERALRTGRIPDVRSPEGLALHPSVNPPANEGARALPASGSPSSADDGARAPSKDEGAGALQASGSRTPQASASLADRFVLEARALGVDVFVEASADEVRERLRALVSGLRVLAWNGNRLPYDCGDVVADALMGSAPRHEQARADAGVTGCHGAIAETGSLALISGPGCSRTASLLPPVHIAIVRHADLWATMGEFLAAREDTMARAANCTFVTGPSRTADIELSLTIGVHGPGKVAIILGP